MVRHVDTIITEEYSSSSDHRTAKITRSEDQEAVGAPVFFTAEELEQLGIDPDDTDRVVVRVEDGFILFGSPESDSEQDSSDGV